MSINYRNGLARPYGTVSNGNDLDSYSTPSHPYQSTLPDPHFDSSSTVTDSTFYAYKTPSASFLASIDRFFLVSARDSSIGVEIRSGLVTFVTMAYILIVNAEVLSKSGIDDLGERMSFEAIATATAISAAIGSGMVGVFGNLPFGLAPGMGLNSYFTYGVCLRLGLSWHVALTIVFVQGILFMLLSLLGACNLIQLYAPPCIKKSITVGLGLFQALIGFELMKIVIPAQEVLLQLGDMSDPRIWLALSGMLLICLLLVLNIKAAMLIGMIFITAIAWITGLAPAPTAIVALPTLSNTFFTLDFTSFFAEARHTIPITLVFLFVSIFDTAGVQFMAGQQAELLDQDDQLPGAKAAFFSAGAATSIGALLGTSPVIIHNETCAGIQDGARTGLSAVTVSICFVLSMPFVPVLRAVPPFATAPPLVIVGMFMMAAAKYIDWERIDEAMPAFLTATILPLTYSIANGMLAGIMAFGLLKSTAWAAGRLGVGGVATTRANGQEGGEERERERILLGSVGLNMNGNGSARGTPPSVYPNLNLNHPHSHSPTLHHTHHDHPHAPSADSASGLVAFDDPLPGSPVPPFVDRRSSLRILSKMNSPARTSNGYGSYDPHF